jgi:hypothetical protein
MLSCIAGLLSFATFVLSNFYSTAQAEWASSARFHKETEVRLRTLEMETKAQREAVAKDINDINKKLDTILVVKLRQPAQ